MPSYLDLGVIGIIVVSALLAMLRGCTREVLGIASWAIAGFAAYYLYPTVLPYVRPYISKDGLALAVSIGIVFLVAIILVSIVTVRISDAILDSKIGALDRSLGFVFGAGRGLLLCAVAFVFFEWFMQGKPQPDWMRSARLTPLLSVTSVKILDMLPEDPDGIIAKFKNIKNGAPAEQAPADAEPENKPSATTPPRAVAPLSATPPAATSGPKRSDTPPPSGLKPSDKQGLDALTRGTNR